MTEIDQNRRLLQQSIDWWEADRNRLTAIRVLAYGLFLGSIAGTIYAGVKGSLPLWGVTVYVFFAVELVFLTFMYAIRHSGQEEIRRAVFDLRVSRLPQWQFERGMLFEFARIAACQAAGVDPHPPATSSGRARSTNKKRPIPGVDGNEEVRALVRGEIHKMLGTDSYGEGGEEDAALEAIHQDSEPQAKNAMEPAKQLSLSFVAYSSETFIELSREIADEIDNVLNSSDKSFDADIHVRVLVRDTSPSHQWLVPLARKERDDNEYGGELRTRFDNVRRSALKEFEESLKNLFPPRHVTFSVRGYRMEPLLKGVMVNATNGILGIYSVSDLKDPEGWDYSGHGIEFVKANVDGDTFEQAAAEFFNSWFDLAWDERYSRPIER